MLYTKLLVSIQLELRYFHAKKIIFARGDSLGSTRRFILVTAG